jgi:DNA-binding transcriptional MerR regulator
VSKEVLTISQLARRAGVPAKTLRYWERRGLLPRAQRTHTGYRQFSADSLRYIAFIRRSKAIGLTLGEMRQILSLAHAGRCPCPEIARWSEAKAKAVAAEIRNLQALQRRLRRLRLDCVDPACDGGSCQQCCTLIAALPEPWQQEKGGNCNEKPMDGGQCCGAGTRVLGSAGGGSRG